MRIGVPRETAQGEARIALAPDLVKRLTAAGAEVALEAGAGLAAGFADARFVEAGARALPDALSLFGTSDIVVKVQPPSLAEVAALREGAALVSLLFPATHGEVVSALAKRRITAFALDLIPRISRAQSMDVLSSQSSLAGYKAALIAADSLPKLFPLMMTAAGTVSPARVLVIGAGVAGLQAIATARRLGARVEAYDIRPAVKEEVESLGARFLALPLAAEGAQESTGYAKAQSPEFLAKQAELLASAVAGSDVVITTAAVPGKRAPVLITAEAVARMRPGSVIVDLAADGGGNCALTEPGATVVKSGVTLHGPLNLPSTLAQDASRMFAHNVTAFLLPLLKSGALAVDLKDEVTRATLVTHEGEIVNAAARAALQRGVP